MQPKMRWRKGRGGKLRAPSVLGGRSPDYESPIGPVTGWLADHEDGERPYEIVPPPELDDD
jgi:hypothetical protein